MPRKKSAPDWPAPKFPNKTVVLAGTLQQPEEVTRFIKEEGGRIASAVSTGLDYLVIGYRRGNKKTPEEKLALDLNRKGASLQILTEEQFYALLIPNREDAVLLLQAGEKGRERWARLWNHWNNVRTRLDFAGINLRGKKLAHCQFQCLILDGADLRDADLTGCALPELKDVRLDGACLHWASFSEATGCSFKKADVTSAHINPAVFTGCDFTEAVLHELSGMYSQIRDSVFRKADLTRARLDQSKFQGLDFSGADLTAAQMSKCDLTGANLAGAKLAGTDLTDAVLAGSDLRRADLTGAILVNADLTAAMVDGANFTGATLTGIRLDDVDTAKARALDLAQTAAGGKIGPNIRELEDVARRSRRLETRAIIDLPDGPVTVGLTAHPNARWVGTMIQHPVTGYHGASQTVSAAMIDLTRKFVRGKLRFDGITIKSSKSPMKPKELRQLALRAWAEAMGVDLPSEEAVEQTLQSARDATDALRAKLLALLKAGPKGIKQWNTRTKEERLKAGSFRRVDLSGVKLDGIDFRHLDFEAANFAGTSLKKAFLGDYSSFRKVNFRGADLRDVDAGIGRFSGSDFTAAVMKKAHLRVCTFIGCQFRDADLEGADFGYADVRGADFSTANLDHVNWEKTRYDERTRWPEGFQPPEGLLWKGKGTDPRIVQAVRSLPASGPLEFHTFLQRLEANTDPARLDKAIAMLKADRFHLFAEVNADSLIGVVKSQTDPDLVYSCRLTSQGDFGCCTQNLNVCGGLRGAPCKHLLVLIVGLSKSRELDPASVDRWVQASRLRKPELDRELMSDTLLRYKGAEAGEIDWRPTETIPEDYYTL